MSIIEIYIYHQSLFSVNGGRYLILYIYVFLQMNNFMQSLIFKVHIFDFCDNGLQFIYLYSEVRFMAIYFHVFGEPIFCIVFYIF